LARKPNSQTASLARAPGVQALGATAPGGPTRAGANYFLCRRAYSNLTRNTKTLMGEPTRETELRLLGGGLRRLRDAAGITQEELARRVQMDPTYISRIERGRRGVQWLTVQRFLRALDADLHQLAEAIKDQEHHIGD
jgi:DNA-binding XRE family transcriptional regulator